ncbi:MAG: anti-sigma F factor antagonist [Caldicoprobacter oshimai]|uniref:Anti-sigma F factor antagonist n=1 Tax=Caldicoprobacter faecalis TaxID=937334 RepID=A0A1I5RJB6_9FIRM|nr:anti-sigma F factor antagonist [Caldicoprobacter faecalis]PZN08250.1 MAG: anti-sigma F factor antagonist [Caldicoprobacter oshimai]SFP58427.1 anti-anti-sigma regulatory factor, SpoIIAA [Caldicoprobacter faecalis]
MQISSHKSKHTLIVKLEGELDHHTADTVRERLDSILEDPSIKHMVFDLSQLKFMDSSGVGVFIGRYKVVSQRGGTVSVVHVTPQIHKVLEVSGLYRIIKKYSSFEEALAGIGGCDE